jgi:hypothetical protein
MHARNCQIRSRGANRTSFGQFESLVEKKEKCVDWIVEMYPQVDLR